MEYRVLVDENTSPRVAESLRGKGITAEHVQEALSEGVNDDTIATFARENGFVVLTHDPDFLDPGTRSGVPVLYYSDDAMDSYEIADRVAELIKWVPNPADLPPLTNLNNWD